MVTHGHNGKYKKINDIFLRWPPYIMHQKLNLSDEIAVMHNLRALKICVSKYNCWLLLFLIMNLLKCYNDVFLSCTKHLPTSVKLFGEAAQFLMVVNGHSFRICKKKSKRSFIISNHERILSTHLEYVLHSNIHIHANINIFCKQNLTTYIHNKSRSLSRLPLWKKRSGE